MAAWVIEWNRYKASPFRQRTRRAANAVGAQRLLGSRGRAIRSNSLRDVLLFIVRNCIGLVAADVRQTIQIDRTRRDALIALMLEIDYVHNRPTLA